MAYKKFRLNLTATGFPLASEFSGRSVVIPQLDENDQTGKPSLVQGEQERAQPALYYCENVIPSSQGYKSVAFDITIDPLVIDDNCYIAAANETYEEGGDTGTYEDDIHTVADYELDNCLFLQILEVRDSQENRAYLGITNGGWMFLYDVGTSKWINMPTNCWFGGTDPTVAVVLLSAGITTYLCLPDFNIYIVNVEDFRLIPAVFTGDLDKKLVKGICASYNYLICHNDTYVQWSSAFDPSNFDLELAIETGTGFGIPLGIKGAIKALITVNNGFVVYTAANAVLANWSGNTQFPWVFTAIANSAGVSKNRFIPQLQNGSTAAWTESGLLVAEPTGADNAFPEVTDFLSGRIYEDYDLETNILRTVYTETDMKVGLFFIGSRFVVISYGPNQDIPPFTDVTEVPANINKILVTHQSVEVLHIIHRVQELFTLLRSVAAGDIASLEATISGPVVPEPPTLIGTIDSSKGPSSIIADIIASILTPLATRLGSITSSRKVSMQITSAIQAQVTTPVVNPPITSVYPPEESWIAKAIPLLAKPALRVSVRATEFSTRLMRISDNSQHHYSKDQPWNSNMTMYRLGGTLYNALTYLPIRSFGMPQEVQWSHLDPNKMFGIQGNQFISVNASNGARTVLRTFSPYAKIFLGPFEGNISNDDRYAAFITAENTVTTPGAHIIVYDIINNVILADKPVTDLYPAGTDIDWVGMSQTGAYVFVLPRGQPAKTFTKQLTLVKSHTFSNSGQMPGALVGGHGDLGIDVWGNEVFVQVGWQGGPIIMTRLDNGVSTSVLQTGIGQPGFMSCRNILRPGRAYAATYKNGITGFEIMSVKLDGSQKIERFAHHRDSVDHIKAVASPDGSKVMWNSNWLASGGSGGSPSIVDAYIAGMVL